MNNRRRQEAGGQPVLAGARIWGAYWGGEGVTENSMGQIRRWNGESEKKKVETRVL